MERELGITLFERDNRNVRLTTAGEQFYDDSRRIVENYNRALKNINDLKQGSKGKLRIGIGIYESLFVSEVLHNFHKHYPGIRVEVNQYTYNNLFNEIACAGLDIVFIDSLFYNAKHKLAPTTVQTYKLFDFDYYAAVHINNPLAALTVISANDLADSVLLLLDNGEESNSERLKLAGVQPREVILFNSLSSMKSLVESDYGICFVPRFLNEEVPSDIKLIPQNFIPTCHYYALYTKQLKNSSSDYYMNTLKESKKFIKKFGC
jgi:LysR family transcriptional activator of glutamate synthase operon